MRSSLDDSDRDRIRKIAVHSALGNELQHSKVGTTIFENIHESVPAANWKVDFFVEKFLVDSLKQSSQLQRIEVAPLPKNFSRSAKEEDILKLVREAKAKGFDALLVMLPSAYDNAPKGTEPGYGVQRISTLFNSHTSVYALAVLNVFDTNTEKSLAWQWAFDSMMGEPNFISKDEVAWKAKFSDYSAEEKIGIQRALKRHLEKALPFSLRALHLLPKIESAKP